MSSSSDGSASFQKVLVNTSGSPKESDAGGRTPSSGRQQVTSSTTSRQADTTQGSGKTSSGDNPASKKPNALTKDIKTSASLTPAEPPPQTSPVPSQASAPLPFAGLPTQNYLPPAGGTASTATPADSSPLQDGSENGTVSGSSGPSATAADLAADASDVLPAPHAGNAKTAVAADAASTAGTSAVGPTDARPEGSGATSPVSEAAGQPDVSSQLANSLPGSALAGSGLSRTGPVSVRAGLDTAWPGGRGTKPLPAADHDGKHKAASSTTTSGDTDAPSPGVISGSGTNGEDRSDSQRSGTAQIPQTASAAPVVQTAQLAQVADLAAIPQQMPTIAQGISAAATPNSSIGTPDAGSATAAAAQSAAHLSGSVTETGSLPALNNAQLIQSARHAEMRLGMQSDEFGKLSISTSLSRQILSTQIFTEHSELGRVLAAQLPAMEQKLSTAYGLQAKVELNSGASSTATTSDGQSQNERQGAASNRAAPLPIGVTAPATTATYPVEPAAAGSSRLDIRV